MEKPRISGNKTCRFDCRITPDYENKVNKLLNHYVATKTSLFEWAIDLICEKTFKGGN